jgi:hypothetical protein
LARIADGLPQTPDAEGYRRLFTQAANHLLPLAHPPNDLRHAINSHRDAQSSINASHKRRHENEIRHREEYDRDHGIPARSQATRTESAMASTGGTTRGQSRHHDDHSPPRDRQHHRRQEDTCGVSALTPHLRAIQWPPNFKVSNVDKYEPKQDPGGWLAVYTTAARAAGATEDVMNAYLPIVLGQDALQWLRHLPRHCIDDWSDFSRRFTANFQSLSDKPAQPWDLKSIKRRGYETLRSYLKRFQTMRNRIPEVAEAAVIEDFYRGSNDSAFVRTILQKAPTTSEQLFREADLYITADERAQDLIGGVKQHQQHRVMTQISSPTSVGRRDLAKKSTPPDHLPLMPEEELVEANARWTTSSTPSARTTKTCATPFRTAETSSTPSGTADPSSLYLLLRRGEDRENHVNPSSRRREEIEPSCVSTERSMSSSADTDRRRTRDNKNSMIARYRWQLPALPPHTDGRSTRSPSLERISGSTSTTQANTRSSSIR